MTTLNTRRFGVSPFPFHSSITWHWGIDFPSVNSSAFLLVICKSIIEDRSIFVMILYCPEQAPTLQFWQFCGFSRFSVLTAHDAKFLHSESEGRSTELTYLRLFWCNLGTTTSGIKGSHTPVRGLVRSVLSLQHEIHVLQTTTKRCGNLAMRLQVGLLCSMIQLSLLSGWPQQSTKKATMQVNLVPPGS